MPRWLTAVLIVTSVVAPVALQATPYVDSQVVCRVQYGADPDTVASRIGGSVLDGIEPANLYLIGYSRRIQVDTIVELLESFPEVIDAQPNYIVRINLDQVSQPFVDQTSQPFVDGHSPGTYYHQYIDRNLLIDSAQRLQTGDGVVVAIVDGGLDRNHPLFAGRLDPAGYDFIENDPEPWVGSGNAADHGTFVAGLVARSAPEAQLMIVRCFSGAGAGNSFGIARGIYHAINNGAHIINMSFSTETYDPAITLALNEAFVNHGIFLSAAAGNGASEQDRFPASHPYVVNVAAVDSVDIKADFSNYGTTVDLTAPGVNLYSSLTGGDVWGWWCGTSFACPLVAGLAALIIDAYPQACPEFIDGRIRKAAVAIDGLNPDYGYLLGSGRIHFLNAVFIPGDANGSGGLNLGDVVYIVNIVFRKGAPSIPPQAADANCDESVDIGDAVYMVNFIFRGGPGPGCDE
jgi:subtilisin family serine protease